MVHGLVDQNDLNEAETGSENESSDSASEVFLQIFMLATFECTSSIAFMKGQSAELSSPQQECGLL